MHNELAQLQELVEGTEVLIVGDYADIEPGSIVEATVIGNYEQNEAESIDEVVINNKDTNPISADENSNSIVVKEDIADDKEKSEKYFKCSISNCYKSYVDEECKICIMEYGLRDMHYCEDHASHFTHNFPRAELILAQLKHSYTENGQDEDRNVELEVNSTLALSMPKASANSKLSDDELLALNTTSSSNPFIEHKDNFDPEVDSEENDKNPEQLEHLQLYALLKSIREVYIFH
jgi:hypothetical protein